MGKLFRSSLVRGTCAIPLLFAGSAWSGDPGVEVVMTQAPSTSTLPRFVFTGRPEGLAISSEYRSKSCCLEYEPVVEVAGSVVRLTEGDTGPPCGCADVPWDLRVELRGLAPGQYDISVANEGGRLLAAARVTIPATTTTLFVRARANGDDRVDLSDAVSVLTYLFLGGKPPPCLDAADVNDDGTVDISDPVRLLAYLFSGGPAPPSPFPEPGEDPTPDSTVCSGEDRVVAADFVRAGDWNGDGMNDISDGVAFLNYLELGGPPPECADAVDMNDDGMLNLDDVLQVCPACGPFLGWLPGPPEARECGPDATPDRLGCERPHCGY
jgi:hypothetical protein